MDLLILYSIFIPINEGHILSISVMEFSGRDFVSNIARNAKTLTFRNTGWVQAIYIDHSSIQILNACLRIIACYGDS